MRRKRGSLKIESHHELFHLWSIQNDGMLAAPQGLGSFSLSVPPKELSVLVLPPQSSMPELLL
jgi:hypothetical protein